MKHLSSVLITSTVALIAFGCIPASVPPATQAAQVEQQSCTASASAQDEQILKSATLLKVSPLYGHVHTSYNDYEARVNGATIYLQPPTGVPEEQMTRILQCHCARALLGQTDQSQAAIDPYYLPNAWLDIDVKRESGVFAVTIRADNVHNGLEVLARAHAFADSRVATVVAR